MGTGDDSFLLHHGVTKGDDKVLQIYWGNYKTNGKLGEERARVMFASMSSFLSYCLFWEGNLDYLY